MENLIPHFLITVFTVALLYQIIRDKAGLILAGIAILGLLLYYVPPQSLFTPSEGTELGILNSLTATKATSTTTAPKEEPTVKKINVSPSKITHLLSTSLHCHQHTIVK